MRTRAMVTNDHMRNASEQKRHAGHSDADGAGHCVPASSLPSAAALAITHAELERLLTPPRRMLSGYGLHGRGRAIGIWTVAADGLPLEVTR